MQQMALVQPFAALTLIPYALLVESPGLYTSYHTYPAIAWVYVALSCVVSIWLLLSMFKITEYTSAMTLSVVGNSRGMLSSELLFTKYCCNSGGVSFDLHMAKFEMLVSIVSGSCPG